MKNLISYQLYITTFNYPMNSVKTLLFKNQTFDSLYKNKEFSIKMFIGSDWSIVGSGFSFFGPNDLKIVCIVSGIEVDDFETINKFSITYINSQKNEKNVAIVLNLISNTSNNSTVIEYRLEYENKSDFEYISNLLDISLIKNIIKRFCETVLGLFKNYVKENPNNKESLKINHSFTINKNYRDAFNFYYNFENIAKSIKTDKIWKIKFENEENDNPKYNNFSVIIKENIKIHYKVVSIYEDKVKIEIIYKKTSNSYPALNEYINFVFFNIGKNLCLFLYETHLPINTNSLVFNTTSEYLFYCNNKSKIYFEKNSKNNI